MIKLITGKRGSGKTKILLDVIAAEKKNTKGNVVAIQKGASLNSSVSTKVRLINIEDYAIDGIDAFYGFIAGILASDYDCTDIFVDATLKIIGRDYEKIGEMFDKLAKISAETTITCTISADNSELTENIKKFIG